MIELVIFSEYFTKNILAKHATSPNVCALQMYDSSNNPVISVWVISTEYWLDNKEMFQYRTVHLFILYIYPPVTSLMLLL